jgi:hypothetical protein
MNNQLKHYMVLNNGHYDSVKPKFGSGHKAARNAAIEYNLTELNNKQRTTRTKRWSGNKPHGCIRRLIAEPLGRAAARP